MPVLSQCEVFPLTTTEIATLWEAVLSRTAFPDEIVSMQCVTEEEIVSLNATYRKKNTPTNILTFSYGDEGEHDIAISLDVARRESSERGIPLREYTALLVVHGLLHVTGMDHEQSEEASDRMQQLERDILLASGFVPQALLDVY